MAGGRRLGAGRPKGSPNKITGQLKDMILQAANQADPDGAVGYLRKQAGANPNAFMGLLGRVLPLAGPGPEGEHKIIVGWDKSGE